MEIRAEESEGLWEEAPKVELMEAEAAEAEALWEPPPRIVGVAICFRPGP